MSRYLVVQQGTPPGNWIGLPDRTYAQRVRRGNDAAAFVALCDGREWPVGERLRVTTLDDVSEDDAIRTAQHVGEWISAVVVGPDSGLGEVLTGLGYTIADAPGRKEVRRSSGALIRCGAISDLWQWLHDSLQVVEIPDTEAAADLEARLAAELRAADRAAYEDACERRGDEQREEA